MPSDTLPRRIRSTPPRPRLPTINRPTCSSSLRSRISSMELPSLRWALARAAPARSSRSTCCWSSSWASRLSCALTKDRKCGVGTSCQTCTTCSSEPPFCERSAAARVARVASSEPSVARRSLVGKPFISLPPVLDLLRSRPTVRLAHGKYGSHGPLLPPATEPDAPRAGPAILTSPVCCPAPAGVRPQTLGLRE